MQSKKTDNQKLIIKTVRNKQAVFFQAIAEFSVLWLAAVINLAAKAFTFFSLMPSIFTLFIGKEQVLAPQWVTHKVVYCYDK